MIVVRPTETRQLARGDGRAIVSKALRNEGAYNPPKNARGESGKVEPDGFLSRGDEGRLATFHRHDWPDRIGLIPSIEDERYRDLGERAVATEQPQLLTATQRTRWQSWRRDRLFATGDVPWLTVADAVAELEEYSEAAFGNQQQQLCDIRHFLRSLEAKRAVE